MTSIIIALLTLSLLFVSVFLIFVVLLQRANTNAGMGTAFGGGLAESTFGADTSNFLTRSTMVASTLFFLISFVVYLLYVGGGVTMQDATLPANLADMESPSALAQIPETPLATGPGLEPALIGELPDAGMPATDTVPTETGSGATASRPVQ